MTCCLAICIPGVAMAAADTRIGLGHDGQRTIHDGPHPFSAEVESLGRTLYFPYRYRKIRKIGMGWAVCAGDYSSGSAVLDALKGSESMLFTQARAVFKNDAAFFERVQQETGISIAQQMETVVIGAPLGHAANVWTLALRPHDDRTHRSAGKMATNWPESVPLVERQRATDALNKRMTAARPENKYAAYAKAMAEIIAIAGRYADDVGPFIQLGQTHQQATDTPQSIYFEGLCEELLSMSDEEFTLRCEVAV